LLAVTAAAAAETLRYAAIRFFPLRSCRLLVSPSLSAIQTAIDKNVYRVASIGKRFSQTYTAGLSDKIRSGRYLNDARLGNSGFLSIALEARDGEKSYYYRPMICFLFFFFLYISFIAPNHFIVR